MTVRDILANKGNTVYTIHEDRPLREAIGMFFEKKIGSLVVVDDAGQVVGILAPTDVLRSVYEGCDEQCSVQRVKSVMTTNPICASEDDTVEQLVTIMTQRRIRHIPVMDKRQLKGLVSIGDIVNAKINMCEVTVHHLTDYIEGKYPG